MTPHAEIGLRPRPRPTAPGGDSGLTRPKSPRPTRLIPFPEVSVPASRVRFYENGLVGLLLKRFGLPVIFIFDPSRTALPVGEYPDEFRDWVEVPQEITPRVAAGSARPVVIAPSLVSPVVPSDLIEHEFVELDRVEPSALDEYERLTAQWIADPVKPVQPPSIQPVNEPRWSWSDSVLRGDLYERIATNIAQGAQEIYDRRIEAEAKLQVEFDRIQLSLKNAYADIEAETQAMFDEIQAQHQADLAARRQWNMDMEAYLDWLEDRQAELLEEAERQAAADLQEAERQAAAAQEVPAPDPALLEELDAGREAALREQAANLTRVKLAPVYWTLLNAPKGRWAGPPEAQIRLGPSSGSLSFDSPSKSNKAPFGKDGGAGAGKKGDARVIGALRLAYAATEYLDVREILNRNLEIGWLRRDTYAARQWSFERKMWFLLMHGERIGIRSQTVPWRIRPHFLHEIVLDQAADALFIRQLTKVNDRLGHYIGNRAVTVAMQTGVDVKDLINALDGM